MQIARQIKNDYGPLLFAWGDDLAPGDDVPAVRLSVDDEDAA